MHYKINEYKEIYLRRAKRFYDLLQSNDDILFVRLNIPVFSTTLEDILEFRRQIELIKLRGTEKMKFMLISTIEKAEDFLPIKHDFVIHRYILKRDVNDVIMKDDIKIQHQLRQFLTEAGYENKNICNIEWTDKSIE